MMRTLLRLLSRRLRRGPASSSLLFLGAVGALWLLLLLLYVEHRYVSPRQPLQRKDGDRDPLVTWREMAQQQRNATGQRCVHPTLQPFHPSVWSAADKPPAPVDCSAAMEDWVYTSGGKFRISKKAQKLYGKITCEYAPILRANDFSFWHAPHIKPMLDGSPIISDFFKVACVAASGKKYMNIHSGVAFVQAVHDRLSAYAEETRHLEELQKNVSRLLPPGASFAEYASDRGVNANAGSVVPDLSSSSHGLFPPGLNLSVFMFGFDSVSRMAWHRSLPQSRKYFINRLGGIELEGYNIVGDGTPAALLPILTGKIEEELPEARRGFHGAKPVDNHPWIWKEFSKRGYVTAHAEDMAFIGTFQMRMLGFRDQPTDHNFRTFSLAAEKIYSQYPRLCLGSVPRHVNFMKWFRDLFDMYRSQPKFFFGFHSEMSHEFNSPLQALDRDLELFLQDLEKRGHLNNTLLILMADHGARFDQVRATIQGRMEERMPYFAFRFPPWFEQQHPDVIRNVRANAKRLTTPFDIHETFVDILNFTGVGLADIEQRGVSLLKEVPKERTCTHAEVTPHWCACLEWVGLPQSDPLGTQVAQAAVHKINNLTSGHRNICAFLRLVRVTGIANYRPSPEDLAAEKKISKYWEAQPYPGFQPALNRIKELYQLSFFAAPGGGHFEVTCSRLASGELIIHDRDISRINKYGRDADCIASVKPHLRPYCYCVPMATAPPSSEAHGATVVT